MRNPVTTLVVFLVVIISGIACASDANWRFGFRIDDASGMGSSAAGVQLGVSPTSSDLADGQDTEGPIILDYSRTSIWAVGVFNSRIWTSDIKSPEIPITGKSWDLRIFALPDSTYSQIRIRFYSFMASAMMPASIGGVPVTHRLTLVDNRGMPGAPSNGTTWTIPVPDIEYDYWWQLPTNLPILRLSVVTTAAAIGEGYVFRYEVKPIPEPSGLAILLLGLISVFSALHLRRQRGACRSLYVLLMFSILMPGCTSAWCQPLIRLQTAVFDPLAGPHLVRSDASGSLRIIQCTGPVLSEWRAALERSGAGLVGYVPDYGFLARMTPEAETAVRAMPFVRWIGPYQPSYRYLPQSAADAEDRPAVFIVEAAAGEDLKAIRAGLSAAGATVLTESHDGTPTLRVEASPSMVPALSAVDGVVWIERYVPPVLLNNVASEILRIPPVWSDVGLYGSGQIVAVCDTGLDTGDLSTLSADFAGRVAAVHPRGRTTWHDNVGHGTHVCGSILGSGILSGSNPASWEYARSFAGGAPEASLVMQSLASSGSQIIGLPDDLNTLFAEAYADGARIHSNSWGGNAEGQYLSYSRNVDEFTWNHKDMVILFAAGNSGEDGNGDGRIDSSSIGIPATAKNCISVGATESVRFGGGYDATYYQIRPSLYPAVPIRDDHLSNNAEGMAGFSSRGPCSDGRVKPDLCAPGTNVISARSHWPGAGKLWGAYNDDYAYSGGTSMATPTAAGAAALVREYFVSRMGWSSVSAAMIKAAMVNGAHDLTPGQYGAGSAQEILGRPDMAQGWGRVDVAGSLLAGGGTRDFQDDTSGLSTGQTATYSYPVAAGSHLRFTLVYTDYPALLSSDVQLVNDLDLQVTDPSGTILYPNRLTGPDALNPVESIDIPNGTSAGGMYSVTISARNVPYGPQPFALAVSTTPGVIDLSRSTKSVSPNGGVHGGDVLTYTIAVRNNGVTAANTTITDSAPPGTAYVPSSTTLNGIPCGDTDGQSPLVSGMLVCTPGASPGEVRRDGDAVVSFQAVVTGNPPPGTTISNTASITCDGGVSVVRSATVHVPGIIRVKLGSAGDGTSWDLALGSVQMALARAVDGDEIWVAAGTYSGFITLKKGVALYGGFAGTETERSSRNRRRNTTILNGTLLSSVVTVEQGASRSTVIDGFTIRNGSFMQGGGIYCYSASPTIANNVIEGNRADKAGGGIYCYDSSPLILNNTLVGNFGVNGGAIYCGYSSSPTISGNVISANASSFGGAVYCYSCSADITNNTLVSNIAVFGGGIYSQRPESVRVVNNIIALNSSGICKDWNESMVVQSNCLHGNKEYDCWGFSTDPVGSGGNFSADPLLADLELGNLHIQPGSPCIDGGDDAEQTRSVDVDGQPRLLGAHIDIGADESDGSRWVAEPVIVRVRPDGDDDNDGSTWRLAKRTVQAGIDAAAQQHGEVWVGAGRYNESIILRAYVYVYGGFAGTESSRSQRSFRSNTTTLDAGGDGRVVTAYAGHIYGAIDGFTVCNGSSFSGAGIRCYYSSPAIRNNVITGNRGNGGSAIFCSNSVSTIERNAITSNGADLGDGSGIWCYASSVTLRGNLIAGNAVTCRCSGRHIAAGLYYTGGYPLIVDNVFRDNAITARNGFGGGMYLYACTATVLNNRVEANSVTGAGGGIYLEHCSPSTVSGNVIARNKALTGGGIYCRSCYVDIEGNTLVDNQGGTGGAVHCMSSSSTLSNNLIAFNSSGVYRESSGTPALRSNLLWGADPYIGVTAGIGDITADPVLVDRNGGDYHLMPDSPCRDAAWQDAPGMSLLDIDKQERNWGTSTDIGADEYWPALSIRDAKLSPDSQDVDIKGVVVTASFDGFYYVEADDRSCGIRVEKSAHGLGPGIRVDLKGVLRTNTDGERYVEASDVVPAGTGSIRPVGLANRWLAGIDWSYRPARGIGQKGVTGGTGLNNVGLLITVWGTVTEIGDGCFYLDDGSGSGDDSGHIGARVNTPPDTIPSVGRCVKVTGISSIRRSGYRFSPLLLVSRPGDIELLD